MAAGGATGAIGATGGGAPIFAPGATVAVGAMGARDTGATFACGAVRAGVAIGAVPANR